MLGEHEVSTLVRRDGGGLAHGDRRPSGPGDVVRAVEVADGRRRALLETREVVGIRGVRSVVGPGSAGWVLRASSPPSTTMAGTASATTAAAAARTAVRFRRRRITRARAATSATAVGSYAARSARACRELRSWSSVLVIGPPPGTRWRDGRGRGPGATRAHGSPGLHGADRDPEQVGGLGLGEVLVVAEHDHGPLPRGQGRHERPDRVVRAVVLTGVGVEVRDGVRGSPRDGATDVARRCGPH